MNGLKRTPAQIKERQQLCRDLSDIIHIHEDGESLLETVLDDLNGEYSIVIFDAALEKQVLEALATQFPAYKDAIAACVSRIVDIAPLFTKYQIMLPGMNGKASMKAILPCLSTDTTYDPLEVKSGFDAMAAYKQLRYQPQASRETIKEQLCDYCRVDTRGLGLVTKAVLQNRF